MSEDKRTIQDLQQLQALPLNLKVSLTKSRIRAWINEYGKDGVYVSFSGGKDSTVLLDIVRQDYPDVPAVFCNTGLEFPEILQFVKTKENVIWLRPKMTFRQVVEKYGYPMFGKEIANTVGSARKYIAELRRRTSDDNSRLGGVLGDSRYVRCGTQDEGGCSSKKQHIEHFDKAAMILGAFGKIQNADGTYGEHTELYEQIKYGTIPEPIRTQILNGTFVNKDGTKSMYNKTKYKFMLNAPFDVTEDCCTVFKKSIAHGYQKATGRQPMTAQMASESKLRTQQWLKNGCNAFDFNTPISNPMSFWTEQDVLLYIKEHNLPIASVYGRVVNESGEVEGQMSLGDLGLFELERPCLKTTGMNRTGCFACLFGYQREKPEDNRINAIIKYSNPKIADYMLRGGEFRESDGLWHPHQGLGYWFLIEYCNKYGKMKMTYPNREYYVEKYSTPGTDKYLKGEET